MVFQTLTQLLTYFSEEETCIQHLASVRWPDGPVCQHCDGFDKISYLRRRRVWWCGNCKKQFSIRVGTIFEGMRAPLQKWFATIWLETSHKKGISSNQLAKDIGVTQKTACHMLHRIREAMGGISDDGSIFSVTEIDEACIRSKENGKYNSEELEAGRGVVGRDAVLDLKECGGNVRMLHVKTASGETGQVLIRKQVMQDSHHA